MMYRSGPRSGAPGEPGEGSCDNRKPRSSAHMDPQRKRKIRLVMALTAAVFLAAALVYVSFSSSSEAKEPSDLLASSASGSYQVTGTVVPGSVDHNGDLLRFRLGDRDNVEQNVPVRYPGTVPDPFREGREV